MAALITSPKQPEALRARSLAPCDANSNGHYGEHSEICPRQAPWASSPYGLRFVVPCT
jgi:hypothetical protein